MAKTIKEVATKVLKKLGRLPGGQVAPADQLKIVTDEYEELFEDLFENSNVNWSSDDDIPEGAAGYIKNLLLGRTADDFGVQNKWENPEYIKIQKKGLAMFLASPYVSQPTPYSDY
jgi:hypothetical protein